jgi:tetratricopeptide (TPR) repeat protein
VNSEQKIAAGNMALTRGLYMEAQRHFMEALQEVRAYGQNDPMWSEIHRGLAQVYLQFQKPDDAGRAAQIALDTDGQYFGPECAANAYNWFLIGDALRMKMDFELSKTAYEKSKHILDREFGSTHSQTIQIFSRMVTLYLESDQQYGFEEIHKEALAAFQLCYPVGTWVKFVRLKELCDDYVRNGNATKAEHMLQRELQILSKLLGKNHAEVAGVLEVHSELLKEQHRLLASWQVSSQTEKLARTATDQLFLSEQRDYSGEMDDCRSVIERMLSMQGSLGANGPTVLQQSWWKVDPKKSSPDELIATLRYNDSMDEADRKAARLKLSIKLSKRGPKVHVDYNCTLANSQRLALARDLVRYTISEIDHTLSVLPTTLVAPSNELRALSIPQGAALWPTPQQYNEAIQHPKHCFGPLELREALPEVNQLGLPKPVSGNFATIYRLGSGKGDWAIKCFTRRITDEHARYRAISARLDEANLRYFVPFQYIAEGIKVHNDWFPMVQMRWVEGKALNVYIVEHLYQPTVLGKLADNLATMIDGLLAAGIAHGDLQHGNILVVEDDLVLVDYDGMWVPELAKFKSNELGHPNYQHPGRTKEHFGSYLDNFAGWLIYCSLRCIYEDPQLWETLQGGDDCLLLRQEDLQNPQRSPRLQLLLTHENHEVREHARVILRLLAVPPEKVPTFATVFLA